jgi:hypothetical protein
MKKMNNYLICSSVLFLFVWLVGLTLSLFPLIDLFSNLLCLKQTCVIVRRKYMGLKNSMHALAQTCENDLIPGVSYT